MKKGRKKTTYFRKDYAPAKIISQQKSSRSASAKISKNLKKTATVIKNTTRKAAASAKKISAKVVNSSRRKKSDFIRNNYAKPRKQSASAKSKSKQKREPFTWREYTLLSMISVSAVAIVVTLGLSALCNPIKNRDDELAKLARDYYVEFLYPSALGNYLDQPETVLKSYSDHGLPNVKLRQLLLYDNGKHLSSKSTFVNSYFECDTNKSYIRYFPVAPYGPYDYTIHVNPVCEETD